MPAPTLFALLLIDHFMIADTAKQKGLQSRSMARCDFFGRVEDVLC